MSVTVTITVTVGAWLIFHTGVGLGDQAQIGGRHEISRQHWHVAGQGAFF